MTRLIGLVSLVISGVLLATSNQEENNSSFRGKPTCNESIVYKPEEISCKFEDSMCCWYDRGSQQARWTLSSSTYSPGEKGYLALLPTEGEMEPTIGILWSPNFALKSINGYLSLSVYCGPDDGVRRLIAYLFFNSTGNTEEIDDAICDGAHSWITKKLYLQDSLEDLDVPLENQVFKLTFHGRILNQSIAIKNVILTEESNEGSTPSGLLSSSIFTTEDLISNATAAITSESSPTSAKSTSVFLDTESIGTWTSIDEALLSETSVANNSHDTTICPNCEVTETNGYIFKTESPNKEEKILRLWQTVLIFADSVFIMMGVCITTFYFAVRKRFRKSNFV